MKKYVNGEKVIFATEKAYEVLYKGQGFKELVESEKATEERLEEKKVVRKKKVE